MYTIEITNLALDDLTELRVYDQRRITNEIARQLVYEPTVETKNRKPLASNPYFSWELRVGAYRVFYDVESDEKIVRIHAIGVKIRNDVFHRGEKLDI